MTPPIQLQQLPRRRKPARQRAFFTVAQVLAEVERSERGIAGYARDGHYFQVEREEDSDRFYIIVAAPCGSRCYDGWWGDDGRRETLEAAVAEAVDGACLLDERAQAQQKGPHES